MVQNSCLIFFKIIWGRGDVQKHVNPYYYMLSLLKFEYTLGFDALEYQEHLDYELIQSTNPEFNKAVVRVNIFRDHRQTIQVSIKLVCK